MLLSLDVSRLRLLIDANLGWTTYAAGLDENLLERGRDVYPGMPPNSSSSLWRMMPPLFVSLPSELMIL